MATTKTTGKNVHQRLLAAGMAIPGIEKKGWNAHFKYNFIREVDVTMAARKALADEGVLFLPSYVSGERGEKGIVTGVVRGRFINVDDPTDFVEIDILSSGQDPGDKGPFKLMTGGVKYLLLKGLNLPTEDDPEGAEEDERPSRPTPSSRSGSRSSRAEEDAGPVDDDEEELDEEQKEELNLIVVKNKWKRREVEDIIGCKLVEVNQGNFLRTLARLQKAARGQAAPASTTDDGPSFN